MGVFERLRPGTRRNRPDPSPEDLLRVAVERTAATVVVRVSGEVDLYTTPLLASALGQAMVGDAEFVLVDLSEVTFMASSGLRVLLDGLERAERRHCELHLAGSTAAVRRLIEAAGLRGVLPGA
ncbi:MAG TPA: STAS domain-containing protein [Pseudonocardiaceae bacterium]